MVRLFSSLIHVALTLTHGSSDTQHQKRHTAQMEWFEKILVNHPSTDGWKIFVFTHAPPNGSGLRVLQENHVVNGCCWLNHSDEKKCSKFIELVREHRCIKAWCADPELPPTFQRAVPELPPTFQRTVPELLRDVQVLGPLSPRAGLPGLHHIAHHRPQGWPLPQPWLLRLCPDGAFHAYTHTHTRMHTRTPARPRGHKRTCTRALPKHATQTYLLAAPSARVRTAVLRRRAPPHPHAQGHTLHHCHASTAFAAVLQCNPPPLKLTRSPRASRSL